MSCAPPVAFDRRLLHIPVLMTLFSSTGGHSNYIFCMIFDTIVPLRRIPPLYHRVIPKPLDLWWIIVTLYNIKIVGWRKTSSETKKVVALIPKAKRLWKLTLLQCFSRPWRVGPQTPVRPEDNLITVGNHVQIKGRSTYTRRFERWTAELLGFLANGRSPYPPGVEFHTVKDTGDLFSPSLEGVSKDLSTLDIQSMNGEGKLH